MFYTWPAKRRARAERIHGEGEGGWTLWVHQCTEATFAEVVLVGGASQEAFRLLTYSFLSQVKNTHTSCSSEGYVQNVGDSPGWLAPGPVLPGIKSRFCPTC